MLLFDAWLHRIILLTISEKPNPSFHITLSTLPKSA